jgi:hypothetical protein
VEEPGRVYAVAWLLSPHCLSEQERQIGVSPSVAPYIAQGVFVVGEQADADAAVGGQPQPVAGAAEGLALTGDESDLLVTRLQIGTVQRAPRRCGHRRV